MESQLLLSFQKEVVWLFAAAVVATLLSSADRVAVAMETAKGEKVRLNAMRLQKFGGKKKKNN